MEWRDRREELKSEGSTESFDFLIRKLEYYEMLRDVTVGRIKPLLAQYDNIKETMEHLEDLMEKVFKHDKQID